MMPVQRIISILAISILFMSCKNKTKEVEEGRIRPVAYSEGDTLELDPYPENLASWLAFYGGRFHDFRNGAFLASGVVLHWDSLTSSPLQDIPDSSGYIGTTTAAGTSIFPMGVLLFLPTARPRSAPIWTRR